MDLLNLAAKITLDDSSYKKGIQNAESLGDQLRGKMSAWTVAMGNLAADMVKKGIQAVTGVINGALDGYADYQQLIGGVETLFKGSSDKVAAYAKQSFRTTGLSANDYMETVTSFSASLLQGLGGDTEAAADLANTAVTDMADNANKMGTDISMIQSAYQGFAKQNYTMLDNLKLGYGGTQSEMVRLINDSGILEEEIKDLDGITFDQMIAAIHKIQEEMGITGTTAKEAAETISGSKASLKAAWEDLLTAVGGGMTNEELDEKMGNFKESFNAYMNNFLPTLVQTIAGSGSLVTAIAGAISDLPKDLLSQVAEAGLESGTEMVGGVSKITSWIIDNITNMFKSAGNDPSKVADFGKAIGDFLGTAISDIVVNAPDIVNGIVQVGVNLAGGLIEGLFKGLFGQGNEVDQITDNLGKELTDINLQATKADAILDYMDQLAQKYGAAARETTEWQEAENQLEDILGGTHNVFESYGNNIQGAIDKLRSMNEELRKTAVTNALQQAVADEMTLLTEQTLEFNKAKAAVQRNASMISSYGQPIREAILTRAEEKRTSIQERMAAGEFVGADEISQVENVLKGFVDLGGEIKSLESLDLSQLNNVLKDLYGGALPKDMDFSQYIADTAPLMAEAQQALTEAYGKAEEMKTQIDATNAAMVDTNAAIEMTARDMMTSGPIAAMSVESGGAAVKQALDDAAGKIAAVDFSGSGGNVPEKAIGINDVPWDGYRAKLHKGEAVLSRSEADKWRNGSSSADVAEMVADAVRDTLEHLYLNMDGKRVADGTTRRTEKNISMNELSRVRAFGG